MTNKELKLKIESATLRRLIKHLQDNKDLQNIDLMNLAGSVEIAYQSGWLKRQKMDINLDYDEVRTDVYGMNYEEWKKKFQKPLNK